MIQYIETKSILSKLREKDTWFGIAYNMNLYRGCQHGCIYCDTRSECYGINDISTISVKKNALDLLAKELPAKRKNKATIGTGSMNDPYMPVEKELQLTRKALQIIASERFPVHIITKSNLVERDADILQDISKTYAAVSFTITAADDSLSQRIEPHAPPSSERFKAMRLLAERGIYTGVTLMPVLPFINDTKENIAAIVERAKASGASYILPLFGVTLRKGSREYFYQMLDKSFAGVREKYHSRFGEQYGCFSPDYRLLTDTFEALCMKFGMARHMRFYRPETYQQQSIVFTNDKIKKQ
jgi:DNA repair photolyase